MHSKAYFQVFFAAIILLINKIIWSDPEFSGFLPDFFTGMKLGQDFIPFIFPPFFIFNGFFVCIIGTKFMPL